jgi:hypothetical protein
MSTQTYLIDTNVIIGLEDYHTVQPPFAALLSVAAKHKVDVMVHEAARDDILRDKDNARRGISLHLHTGLRVQRAPGFPCALS